MEAVLSLLCQRCKKLLMRQKVSCGIGNTATLNIDELAKLAGPCCNRPNRIAKVEITATDVIVDSPQVPPSTEETL